MPEFEELAAMQAGFGYRPVTVRRDGVANQAQSVMGEFVSGNYFRTFGLKPAAGRLFTDADDIKGAPMTAVMSYDTWQNTYQRRSLRRRQHLLDQHQARHHRRRRAPGLLWRPPHQHAAGFLSAHRESMPCSPMRPTSTIPEVNWLYMIGRVKPGVGLGPLAAEDQRVLRQTFAENDKDFKGPRG